MTHSLPAEHCVNPTILAVWRPSGGLHGSKIIDFCKQTRPPALSEATRVKAFENSTRVQNSLTSNPEKSLSIGL